MGSLGRYGNLRSLEETGEKLPMEVGESMKWRHRNLMRKARCKVWAGGQGNRGKVSRLQQVPRSGEVSGLQRISGALQAGDEERMFLGSV